jgi:hypothetical protein
MKHVPSIIGAAILFGICYVMSYVTLSSVQAFTAIVAAIAIYSATVFWYIRTNL